MDAGLVLQRRPAHEEGVADRRDLRVAEHRLQVVRLVDEVEQGFARLRVVEGRMEMVHPQHALGAELVGGDDPHARIPQHGQEVGARVLDVVDLAVLQREHRRLRVANVKPLDPSRAGRRGRGGRRGA